MVTQAKAEDTALFLVACHFAWLKEKDENALRVLMRAAQSPEPVIHSVAEWLLNDLRQPSEKSPTPGAPGKRETQ